MKSNEQAEAVSARLDAEDRAIAYLVDGNRFPPQVSTAVATRVEFFLAVAWENEQEDMRTRRSRREVMEISICDMRAIREAFAENPPRLSDGAAEQHVLSLLNKFPRDRAWDIARKVRRAVLWECRNARVA
jgi:hypothetical protein